MDPELATAKWSMNFEVREALESRSIFDPASLDATPMPGPPLVGMLIDEALELGDGGRLSGASVVPGYSRPWMPWEIIL
jgi:hypothetical protein